MPKFTFISKETVYYETEIHAENEDQAREIYAKKIIHRTSLTPIEYENFQQLFCSITFEENENA